MIKVGITGNIASGKSTVQKILKDMDYKVIDADEVSSKFLTVNNKELYEAFKDYDVFENGEFSRYKVGQLIFSQEIQRVKIASIMHPQIIEEIAKFFEDNKDEKIAFAGVPLLFEANMQDMFDVIIFVYTDDNIRLERLLKRNNYTIQHAKDRMASQKPQEQKIELSNYVIKNNDNFGDLEKNIKDILEQINV